MYLIGIMACQSFAVIGEALRHLVHYNGFLKLQLSGISDITLQHCRAIAARILRR
jgi:hypothetical protein